MNYSIYPYNHVCPLTGVIINLRRDEQRRGKGLAQSLTVSKGGPDRQEAAVYSSRFWGSLQNQCSTLALCHSPPLNLLLKMVDL